MSTPTGRPDRPASAFDYAPKRVREQWARGTSEAAEGEPANDQPRDLDEDRVLNMRRGDQDERSSLVPTGPHEDPDDDRDEAEDERAERWDHQPEHGAHAYDRQAEADAGDGAYDEQYEAQYEQQHEEPEDHPRDPYDEHLERLAATLRTLRGEDDGPATEQPAAAQARPPRGLHADAADRDVYIDGTRLPRFLQPSYVPPSTREGGYFGAFLAVVIACLVAAPLAYYVAFGNPLAPARRAIQARPELQYAVVSTSESLPRPEERQAEPIASAVAPDAPVAHAPQAQPERLTALRPLESQARVPAPRAVPLTHVTRWPDEAQDSAAAEPPRTASVAPPPDRPRANRQPAPAPPAYALAVPSAPAAAPSPSAAPQPPTPAPTMDADEIQLLLKQGQDFIAAGDLATARIVLRRAAEAGAAAAALALGQTFDPKVLAKMGVRGVAADAAEARRWYETAQRLGSSEAAQRLERLARDE